MDVELVLKQNRHDPDLLTEKLVTFKKGELKECVRGRNMPVSGNKMDLVKRLLKGLENGGCGDHTASSPSSSSGGGKGRSAVANGGGARRQRTKSENERLHLRRAERENIVLWKKPFTTVHYGTVELVLTTAEWCSSLLKRKLSLLLAVTIVGLVYAARLVEGPHQANVEMAEKYLLWCVWWVGLGVLSSVGLGTGLHTFLLYLGPHIAAVTLAAHECGSTDFPSPPYPDSIVCRDSEASSGGGAVTVWEIMSKVRVEAFCWGVGTALGELPPYFMARAHRISGRARSDDDDDDEEKEFFDLQEKGRSHPEDLNLLERAKLEVERLVEGVGFLGILACASIPNPLFDLAGITCGHFLVPFWTFFGATLVGKAVVKMHIQKLFVIMAFNETLVETAVSHLQDVPFVGRRLEKPFKEALRLQKEKLHRKTGSGGGGGGGNVHEHSAPLLSWIFEKLVLAMVAYFFVSILNSLAQSYHKRIHRKRDGKLS